MKIILNGEKVNLSAPITVGQLVKQYNLDPAKIVVEINLTIMDKNEYDQKKIEENDKVEFISFMGGG